ncbi:hypothetical protein EMCRGX_G004715 [Ephydatia muelleri]
MHGKVLLTQFVLQCNSFTPIVCRPHHKYCMQAGTSHSQDAHTLCAYACTCRWFMCWSMHLNMPLVLSHTNSQGVATCQSVVSCPSRASLYVYKGDVYAWYCTGKFVFCRTKGHVKLSDPWLAMATCVTMNEVLTELKLR